MSNADLTCAGDMDLGERPTNVPSMRNTILGYFRPIQFTRLVKKSVDFRIVESEELIDTRGVVQPLKFEELKIKPEGERSWNWQIVHATADLILATDDVVVFKGARYRVKSVGGYDDYGFVSYQLLEDYERAPQV